MWGTFSKVPHENRVPQKRVPKERNRHMEITRESPVTVLNGVGKTRAAAYARLGVVTLGDLIQHYPRAYENRGDVCLLTEARTDGKSAVILTVATEPKSVRLRSHKSFLKFRAFDDEDACEITYFNQNWRLSWKRQLFYSKSNSRKSLWILSFGKVFR